MDSEVQDHEDNGCGGCIYWDGDDGRCWNASAQRFKQENGDGCDKKISAEPWARRWKGENE